MVGIKLHQTTLLIEATEIFHLFDEPCGTIYDQILGEYFQKDTGIDILNVSLNLRLNGAQFYIVVMG